VGYDWDSDLFYVHIFDMEPKLAFLFITRASIRLSRNGLDEVKVIKNTTYEGSHHSGRQNPSLINTFADHASSFDTTLCDILSVSINWGEASTSSRMFHLVTNSTTILP
jgi:hypothetical protein